MDNLYSSANRIESLKTRVERCVCKFCGGPLRLHRIIFSDIQEARVEIFCEKCDRIEFGIEPEIYQSARNFVDNLEFNYYPDLGQNEYVRKMNIAKVCEIMAWGCKNMGILSQDGFTVPVDMQNDSAEYLILSTDEIEIDKVFEDFARDLL